MLLSRPHVGTRTYHLRNGAHELEELGQRLDHLFRSWPFRHLRLPAHISVQPLRNRQRLNWMKAQAQPTWGTGTNASAMSRSRLNTANSRSPLSRAIESLPGAEQPWSDPLSYERPADNHRPPLEVASLTRATAAATRSSSTSNTSNTAMAQATRVSSLRTPKLRRHEVVQCGNGQAFRRNASYLSGTIPSSSNSTFAPKASRTDSASRASMDTSFSFCIARVICEACDGQHPTATLRSEHTCDSVRRRYRTDLATGEYLVAVSLHRFFANCRCSACNAGCNAYQVQHG